MRVRRMFGYRKTQYPALELREMYQSEFLEQFFGLRIQTLRRKNRKERR